METPGKYNLRSRGKKPAQEVSPDSTAAAFATATEDIHENVVVPLQMEEEAQSDKMLEFELPEDVVLNENDRILFTYLQSKLQEDIPVYYYFPTGTRQADRNFVFNTLILFSDWRNTQQYNAPEAVIDQALQTITSSAGPSNKTAAVPFKVEFGSLPSFCSALVYLSRKRNHWPAAKQNLPKLSLCVGNNSHDFFPFTG